MLARSLGLVCMLACAQAAPAAAENLTGELQELLRTHPEIQSKTKAVTSAEEGIGVARSGYLPSVKLNNSTGPQYVSSHDRWTTEGEPFFRSGTTSGVSVTEHVFDGYATDSAVGAAKVNRDINQADLRTTRQDRLLDGTKAYIAVLQASRLIELARDNVRKVEDGLNLEDERVEKGAGIAADVLQAKQRLQLAKEQRVRFEGELQAALAKYIQLFGHAPDAARMNEPPVPVQKLPTTLQETLAEAEHNNPAVETAEKSIELTEQKKLGAEAGYYPTVDVVGRADIENGNGGVNGTRRDWSVLVVANWEVFSGWKTKRQVAQASEDNAASKDSHLYSVRKVQELARAAWYKLANDRERIGLLENAAILAEDVWDSTRKRHEAGKATVRDVLDDETRIDDARIRYTQAYYDMVNDSYDLLAAIGRMEVDTLEGLPPGGSEEYNNPLNRSMTLPMGVKAASR